MLGAHRNKFAAIVNARSMPVQPLDVAQAVEYRVPSLAAILKPRLGALRKWFCANLARKDAAAVT